MRRVYGSADVKVDVGSLLKEQTADKRCAVPLVTPVGIAFVVGKVVFGVFEHLVYGDYALGHKVYALNFGNGRNVRTLKIKAWFDRLAQILCRNGRGCAAADNVLAFF